MNFFILGNHPAISIAEILQKLKLSEKDVLAFSEDFLIVQKKIDDIQKLQKELGGTIKIGELLEGPPEEILRNEQKNFSGKFQFGLSLYGKQIQPREVWETGLRLKNILREHGSVRFVRPQKGQALSSVMVRKNVLVGTDLKSAETKGIELCFLHYGSDVLIGKTISVQDFEGLSKRDYGRPERDANSGMIPPKLAQIMINISGCPEGGILWDPFCGSGTILQEALLMGYKKVIGSDISERAVEDTKKNLEWLKHEFGFSGEYEVKKMDVREQGEVKVDVIVTEPFLGLPKNRMISREIASIEELYRNALANWHSKFPNIQTIVMIWPVFVERGKSFYLSPSILQKKWIPQSVLSQRIKSFFQRELSPRGNLLYGRAGQGVMREIVVLRNEKGRHRIA